MWELGNSLANTKKKYVSLHIILAKSLGSDKNCKSKCKKTMWFERACMIFCNGTPNHTKLLQLEDAE